jgi:hypothetical protein
MEDVLRILVIVGLATWAGWGFMVGLRAKEGRVTKVSAPPTATHGAVEDQGDDEPARLHA